MGRGANTVRVQSGQAQTLLFGHRANRVSRAEFDRSQLTRGLSAQVDQLIAQLADDQPEPLLQVLERYQHLPADQDHPALDRLVAALSSTLEHISHAAGQPQLDHSRKLTGPTWDAINRVLESGGQGPAFTRLARPLIQASCAQDDSQQLIPAVSVLSQHSSLPTPFITEAATAINQRPTLNNADPKAKSTMLRPHWAQAQVDLILDHPGHSQWQPLMKTLVSVIDSGWCDLRPDQFKRIFADTLPEPTQPLRQVFLDSARRPQFHLGQELHSFLANQPEETEALRELRQAFVARLASYAPVAEYGVFVADELRRFGFSDEQADTAAAVAAIEVDELREQASSDLYQGITRSEQDYCRRSKDLITRAVGQACQQAQPDNSYFARLYHEEAGDQTWEELRHDLLQRRFSKERQIADRMRFIDWQVFWADRWKIDQRSAQLSTRDVSDQIRKLARRAG